MTKIYKFSIYFFLNLLFLTSCNKTIQPLDLPTETPNLAQSYTYPYPQSEPSQVFVTSVPDAYPNPSNIQAQGPEIPEKLSIPNPEINSGIVIGKLLNADGQPFIGSLYIAKLLAPNEDTGPILLAFSENEDPLASQDITGRFLFSNIPPGKYGLVLWSPGTSLAITEQGTQNYLVIEVVSNKLLDIGDIYIP